MKKASNSDLVDCCNMQQAYEKINISLHPDGANSKWMVRYCRFIAFSLVKQTFLTTGKQYELR